MKPFTILIELLLLTSCASDKTRYERRARVYQQSPSPNSYSYNSYTPPSRRSITNGSSECGYSPERSIVSHLGNIT